MNHAGLAPEIDARLPQVAAMADTTDEMIRAVRQQVKYGADWIKVYVTSNLKQVDPDDARADLAVQRGAAARASSRRQAAGAGTWRRTPTAARARRPRCGAGVRSIEHGMLLDEETLALMVERGVYWCPTFANMRPTHALAGYPDAFVGRVMARHREAFREGARPGGEDRLRHRRRARGPRDQRRGIRADGRRPAWNRCAPSRRRPRWRRNSFAAPIGSERSEQGCQGGPRSPSPAIRWTT